MSEQCKERIYDDWGRSRQCSRASVLDGYCKQHHPDTAKARKGKYRAERDARWERERGPFEQIAKFTQQRDELLEALERVMKHFSPLAGVGVSNSTQGADELEAKKFAILTITKIKAAL